MTSTTPERQPKPLDILGYPEKPNERPLMTHDQKVMHHVSVISALRKRDENKSSKIVLNPLTYTSR